MGKFKELCVRQCLVCGLALALMTYNLSYEQPNYSVRHQLLDESDITVMTYNVRGSNLDNLATTKWSSRKKVAIEMINIYHPDLIGVQEPQMDQINTFKNLGYDSYGKFLQTSVLYKPDKFKVIDGDTVWLSQTPYIPHTTSWDMDQQRVITWALLQNITGTDNNNNDEEEEEECSTDQYLLFNTHLDHKGDQSRLQSCYLIKELIHNISTVKYGDKYPFFVTGDFNVAKYSNVHDCFIKNETDELQLYDALHTAEYLGNKKKLQYTYHLFHGLQFNAWYTRLVQYLFYGFSNSIVKWLRNYYFDGVCCMSCSLYHTIFQRKKFGRNSGVHHLDWILHNDKIQETKYFEVVTYHHQTEPDSNRRIIITPKDFFHDRILRKTVYPSDHFPIITGFKIKS